MCWNAKYALLLFTSTLITYISGILIDRANKLQNKKKSVFWKKTWVLLSFLSNLSILALFKYSVFFIDGANAILEKFQIQIPVFDLVLPVGISFYTFQALSYTMDIYRNEVTAEKNLAKYALFVSFFPQLVAGPIERSKNLLLQINERHKFDYENVKDGFLLMLWGFFQKIVIADRVAILVNEVYGNYENYGGFQLIVATIFFAIQIYCDFSGYSDIAIGTAQMMGFRLMKNFKQPYFSQSVAEFWRRWHISLSTWFKDYLYIPLGGNKNGKLKKYFNLMIVFLISGLWHGANWTFVGWGGINGIYQVLGEILDPVRKKVIKKLHISVTSKKHKLLKICITFSLISFSWIFFRAQSISEAVIIIKRMLTIFNPWIFLDMSIFELGLNIEEFLIAVIAIMILVIVSILHYKELALRQWIKQQAIGIRWIIYYTSIFIILLWGIYGVDYQQSQFIYFQF